MAAIESSQPTQVHPGDVLRWEAQSLLRAADRVDEAVFGEAVELVRRCEGTVIATGAGTSGIIARKIAATMTSIGTPTVFLHPSDALHGGLGNVRRADVAIAVSNSGETDEVLVLLPYLRERDVQLISIVGSVASTLAGASDVALDASVEREAGHHDLVPTASTTVALAVGDALALAVMAGRAVTPEAFARNHPSGRLGRRLTLRVGDLMHSDERAPQVRPTSGWLEVVSAITGGGLGAVAVVEDGRLVGIVTDGDLRRMMQQVDGDFQELVAADLMTRDPTTAPPDALGYDVLRLMEDRPSQISVVPVVDAVGRYLGMVRVHDLIRAGL